MALSTIKPLLAFLNKIQLVVRVYWDESQLELEPVNT